MFKAVDAITGAEVISLNAEHQHDVLRERGRADRLRCPLCAQNVLFRAGQFKRAHFAHRAKTDCPHSNESPELLHGRAVLYQWLRTKFKEGVTLEKVPADLPEGYDLPRPVDCWVERLDGRALAYWIFDRGVRPYRRNRMLYCFDLGRVGRTVVFLSRRMRRNPHTQTGGLILGTTEREAIQLPNDYDQMQPEYGRGSLHYLDPNGATVTTFRAVHQPHGCGDYLGNEHTTALAELQVGGASIRIADRRDEEFDESFNRPPAGPHDQRRQLGRPNCQFRISIRKGRQVVRPLVVPHFVTHNVLYDTRSPLPRASVPGRSSCG